MTDNATSPTTKTVWMLWGRSERFPEPQFLTGYADGIVDMWQEEHARLREAAIVWFLGFDDDPEEAREEWTFWETCERIAPHGPDPSATWLLVLGPPRDGNQ